MCLLILGAGRGINVLVPIYSKDIGGYNVSTCILGAGRGINVLVPIYSKDIGGYNVSTHTRRWTRD